MARVAKITRAKFVEAVVLHHGNMKMIAETIGVSDTSQIYRFIQAHPDLREMLDDQREQLIDVAEDVVIQAIKAGDVASARWFLETRGKHRGYSRRAEITGANGGPIHQEVSVIEVEIVDPARVIEGSHEAVG